MWGRWSGAVEEDGALCPLEVVARRWIVPEALLQRAGCGCFAFRVLEVVAFDDGGSDDDGSDGGGGFPTFVGGSAPPLPFRWYEVRYFCTTR